MTEQEAQTKVIELSKGRYCAMDKAWCRYANGHKTEESCRVYIEGCETVGIAPTWQEAIAIVEEAIKQKPIIPMPKPSYLDDLEIHHIKGQSNKIENLKYVPSPSACTDEAKDE